MKKSNVRFVNIILSLIIILNVTSINTVSEVDDEYISNPGNVPQFDIQSSSIEQGETGELSFKIENRYSFTMENVSLTLNIFKYATENTSEVINNIENAPKIVNGAGGTTNNVLDNQTILFQWTILKDNTSKSITIRISASKNTPVGTYFIRMNLTFEYQSKIYIMKSRGYFTQDEWDYADLTAKPTDPDDINLTALVVHGIIPDTSIRVVEDEEHSAEDEEESSETGIINICLNIWVSLIIILIIFITLIILVYRILRKSKEV